MKSLSVFICFFIAVLAAGPVKTDELEGVNDPDLEEAIGLWLQDDDEAALPRLSKLANDGNVAAAIFLARLENRPGVQPTFVRKLSRSERIQIFRKNTGAFGRSWMSVHASKNPLAETYSLKNQPLTELERAVRLRDVGEKRASLEAFIALTRTAPPKVLLDLWQSGELPEEMLPFVWSSAPFSPDHPAFTEVKSDIGAALSAGDIRAYFAFVWIGSIRRDSANIALSEIGGKLGVGKILKEDGFPEILNPSVESWIMSDRAFSLIVGACSAACPEQTSACSRAAYAMVGGYIPAVTFGSPLENVISEEEYRESPRIVRDLARLAATNPKHLKQADGVSQCFARYVREEL